ncbi:hypothetical protein K5S02_13740 [Klebsiella sp. M581]|uniref:hypothetical protein n=1 Tax=unclassified Klebsiella TaxID=2608929 RepID=UPI001C8DC3E9|nr:MULTISPECIES: hypothetical protein [unclassified Klebsiella]MBY0739111.1 hypothetical protein [Klebsiella sp. M589]MBY0748907.1 hypothetical protein [Klebsiella sp. M581]
MNSIMPSAVCSHYSTIGVAESRRFEYWNDVVYFSHAFRKAFGISPRSLLPKEQQGATPSNRHTGSDP